MCEVESLLPIPPHSSEAPFSSLSPISFNAVKETGSLKFFNSSVQMLLVHQAAVHVSTKITVGTHFLVHGSCTANIHLNIQDHLNHWKLDLYIWHGRIEDLICLANYIFEWTGTQQRQEERRSIKPSKLKGLSLGVHVCRLPATTTASCYAACKWDEEGSEGWFSKLPVDGDWSLKNCNLASSSYVPVIMVAAQEHVQ